MFSICAAQIVNTLKERIIGCQCRQETGQFYRVIQWGSPGNHKHLLIHTRKKPPICACVISDLELIKNEPDAARPEEQ